MASLRTLFVAAACVCAGCYSGIDGKGGADPGADPDGGGTDADDDDDDDDDDDAELDCDGPLDFTPTPMARLSRDEYVRSVRDLLGVQVDPSQLGGDERVGPFAANVATSVSKTGLLGYRDVAEAAAASADLDALLGCDASDDACATSFIDAVGRRAFRRPLSEDERSRLTAVFEHGRDALDTDYGIELVIQAMLQDPSFLYRIELGEPDPDAPEQLRLTDYEIATRMSFFLWGSIPDDALLDLAEAGSLGDPEQRESAAREMLADPRAREGIARLYTQWFGAAGVQDAVKDAERFPDYTTTLAAAMEQEIAAISAAWVLDDEATLADLLLSTGSRVSAELAAFYGVEASGPPDADGLYAVELPADERAGLLTRAGVMARLAHSDQTAPVIRGLFVRESLLCQSMPAPPADVDDTVPPPSPESTTRERFEQHRSDPSCAGCHELLDPVGFAFEHYDATGRYVASIDATGELIGTLDIDGPVDGALELSQRLVESEEVRRCTVRQHASLAFVREPEAQSTDACWLAELEHTFADGGDDLQSLMVAIVAHETFTRRKVADAPEGE